MHPTKVEVSHKTILFTSFFFIFLWFLFKIRSVLLVLFIAIIMMSALSPIVDRLQKHRIPRGVAIFLLYILIWSVISFGVASLIPPLVDQSSKFISILPEEVNRLSEGRLDMSIFAPQLNALPQQIIKLALGIFSNVIGIFTFMVIVYYLILDRRNLHKYLVFIFGDGDREAKAESFINRIEQKLGSWVRGQLALMIIVGLTTYLGLLFLGVDYAVALAFLAGLLEIIPNVGPTLAAVPATIVAYSISPVMALAVIALYLLIQQLENNLIVPRVMSKAVGLNPLVIIVVLLIGFKVSGVAGAVLAIPTTLVVEIVINDLYRSHYKKARKQ
jgi:predicted PurR-regulated permease PerM